MAKKQPTDALLKELREFGLTYPGAHTKSPWPGHLDLAVNDKTFAYLSVEGDPFKISCKLPQSSALALLLPFTEPTAYGLGKSGWVSAHAAPGQTPDGAMFKGWIDESYRAQAPKKLVKELDARAQGAAPTKASTTKSASRANGAKAAARGTTAGSTNAQPAAKAKPAAKALAAKAAHAKPAAKVAKAKPRAKASHAKSARTRTR
jgi:predicted DNA-binding protein (MmcQ/YjbR family)